MICCGTDGCTHSVFVDVARYCRDAVAGMGADDCDARGQREDLMTMRRAIGENSFDKAAKAAEKLIQAGFTNIEAHVVCSQAYAGLGNPEKANFHRDVARGLIRSIFKTGDGKSKETWTCPHS
jgi:hypothetical protein